MNNSMINPSIMELLEKVDDRYTLVTITSKRARQIIDGSEPQVYIKSKKALTIGIQEIYEGVVEYHKLTEDQQKLEDLKNRNGR